MIIALAIIAAILIFLFIYTSIPPKHGPESCYGIITMLVDDTMGRYLFDEAIPSNDGWISGKFWGVAHEVNLNKNVQIGTIVRCIRDEKSRSMFSPTYHFLHTRA